MTAMKKSFIILTLLGVLLWMGCAPVELVPEVVPERQAGRADSVWTLTVRAEMNDNPQTKGLGLNGNDEASATVLTSVWVTGEKVYVYLGDDLIGTLTARADTDDDRYATLTGEVSTTGITPGSTQLTLLTPHPREDWTYVGQTGLLLVNDGGLSGLVNSIAARYDFAQAEVQVTEVTGNNLMTKNAVFGSQQSIYRLSFCFQKSEGESKTPITVQRLTITGAGAGLWKGWNMGTGPISVILYTPTEAPFFVALRNEDTINAEDLIFEVYGTDGVTYLGRKNVPAKYKPNGAFLSAKNTTLSDRLGVPEISTGSVETAL